MSATIGGTALHRISVEIVHRARPSHLAMSRAHRPMAHDSAICSCSTKNRFDLSAAGADTARCIGAVAPALRHRRPPSSGKTINGLFMAEVSHRRRPWRRIEVASMP
ncbi:MAG: hypothetical protein AAF899_10115 [Pseudomonadota bacterium]